MRRLHIAIARTGGKKRNSLTGLWSAAHALPACLALFLWIGCADAEAQESLDAPGTPAVALDEEGIRPVAREDEAAPDADAEESDAPAAEAPRPRRPGDVVRLKSGSVLEGVQVLRGLPSEYVIEVSEGITVRIPRSQVVLPIEYDNLEEADLRRMRAEAARAGKSRLIPGQKMPDVSSRLNKDISLPAQSFANEDIMTILSEMGRRAEVEVVADQSIEELPREQRLWTFETSEGNPVTLKQILTEILPRDRQDLTAVYQFDSQRAEELKAAGAYDASETPDAAAAPAAPATPPAPVPAAPAPATPTTVAPAATTAGS
jgi:hypothetical protein